MKHSDVGDVGVPFPDNADNTHDSGAHEVEGHLEQVQVHESEVMSAGYLGISDGAQVSHHNNVLKHRLDNHRDLLEGGGEHNRSQHNAISDRGGERQQALDQDGGVVE